MRIAALILITIGFSGFLTACTHTNPFPINMSEAVQKASSPCDHEGLSKHYEDTAEKLNFMIKEHKKALSAYGAVTSKYEKEGPDFQNQTEILINLYEQAAKVNANMANSHKTIADEIK